MPLPTDSRALFPRRVCGSVRCVKRLRKILVIIVSVLVGVVVLDAGFVLTMSAYRPKIDRVDAVIVLGAAVGTPALRERTLTGYGVYAAGKTDVIVLAGGQGPYERSSEAAAMEKIVSNEVAKTPLSSRAPLVLLDDASTNTFQNIRNARALVPQAKSVVIVSDTFHLGRAVLMARRVGFSTVRWDAPTPSYYPRRELVGYFLREMVGMIAYIPRFVLGR